MKTVTIRYNKTDYDLVLDFNRTITDVLDKIDIELKDNQLVVALLSNRMINPQLSFIDNNIENNEILEIKGNDEFKL